MIRHVYLMFTEDVSYDRRPGGDGCSGARFAIGAVSESRTSNQVITAATKQNPALVANRAAYPSAKLFSASV
jgi:hypothetical protein